MTDLVNLRQLMSLTSGRSEVVVGMVDGPVAADHPDLAQTNIQELPGKTGAACAQIGSAACVHGTFVAGILSAKRGSAAPAICPDCTLLVSPVFSEAATGSAAQPSSTPEELAAAILNCIEAGARIVNLSLAVTRSSSKGERALKLALDHAARLGVVIVAAAGNQGTVGGTVITNSSLGHRRGRMRRQRQTPQWVQSRVFHWAAWSARPRRRRHQPGAGLPIADPWRHERRCAVRDRRCRPGVVPATGGERSANSPGVPTSALSRTSLRDAPAAGCMGRLPTRDREVSHDRR